MFRGTEGSVERDRQMAWLEVANESLETVETILAQQSTDTLEEWHADADWLRGLVAKELKARGA